MLVFYVSIFSICIFVFTFTHACVLECDIWHLACLGEIMRKCVVVFSKASCIENILCVFNALLFHGVRKK